MIERKRGEKNKEWRELGQSKKFRTAFSLLSLKWKDNRRQTFKQKDRERDREREREKETMIEKRERNIR